MVFNVGQYCWNFNHCFHTFSVYIINHIIEKLELINPLGVLKRGYSLTYKDDKIVNSVKQIKKDDILNIKLVDGNISTKVIGSE